MLFDCLFLRFGFAFWKKLQLDNIKTSNNNKNLHFPFLHCQRIQMHSVKVVVDLDFIHAGVYAEVYLQGTNLFSRFFSSFLPLSHLLLCFIANKILPCSK